MASRKNSSGNKLDVGWAYLSNSSWIDSSGNLILLVILLGLITWLIWVDSLQDFTILPTDEFRWCVIKSSLVIFLLTSSPTDYVRRLTLYRWFPLPLLYRSTICWWFYRRNLRAKKKKDFTTDFHSVGDIVIDRWKISVGECMKYRLNISICKFIGTGSSYC